MIKKITNYNLQRSRAQYARIKEMINLQRFEIFAFRKYLIQRYFDKAKDVCCRVRLKEELT